MASDVFIFPGIGKWSPSGGGTVSHARVIADQFISDRANQDATWERVAGPLWNSNVPIQLPDGSIGNQSLQFDNGAHGLYSPGLNIIAYAAGGSERFRINGSQFIVDGGGLFGFAAASPSAGAPQVMLSRVNATTLRLYSSAPADTEFRVLNTAPSANEEFVRLAWGVLAGSRAFVGTGKDGAGTLRNIDFGTNTELGIVFNGSRLITFSSGNIIWPTDNTYDIGASGANRPRTGYFGTSVVSVAGNFSGRVDVDDLVAADLVNALRHGWVNTGSYITSPSDGDFSFFNSGDTGTRLNVDVAGTLQILQTNGTDSATLRVAELRFGTHSAIGAETLSGFITVTDNAGNSRKLAVVS